MKSSLYPLGFTESLRKVDWGIEPFPFLGVLVICLMFLMLGSGFIFYPGMSVDLPQVKAEGGVAGVNCSAVVTIKNEKVAMFMGAVCSSLDLQNGFKDFIRDSKIGDLSLLIRADAQVKLEVFSRVCEQAKEAGFKSVHIAVVGGRD